MDERFLIALIKAVVVIFVVIMSLVKEPARRTFNAIVVAGASGVYLGGGFGPWELLYPAIATPVGNAVAASPRVERTPFGPSAKRSAGMPRRGSALVEKLSAPATSAAFSFNVRRASRSAIRCSSAAAEFL